MPTTSLLQPLHPPAAHPTMLRDPAAPPGARKRCLCGRPDCWVLDNQRVDAEYHSGACRQYVHRERRGEHSVTALGLALWAAVARMQVRPRLWLRPRSR